ncbi:MAG: NUDIX hydrolase [Betaproteobacteria bacterium]|nr:NUDIX hydrolase [Betaproteobacteria bacterium]
MSSKPKTRTVPEETIYSDAPSAALHPLLSVDTIIFSVIGGRLNVLLVKRAFIPGKELSYPFQGKWALVGGLLDTKRDASLEDAALRRLLEKTNLRSPYLEQLQSFGNALRDPRKWAATVVYFALIAAEGLQLQSGTSVEEVRWWPIDDAVKLKLAFDHSHILEVALHRLRSKVEYTTLPANLLPAEFTLSELQAIYEIILGRSLDKSSFRKRVLSADFVDEARNVRKGPNRPAQLYRIKPGRNAVVFPRTFYS